ncbi:MAG: formimidoylglutamase [Fimbriimonadaceae bacterium]|nr:formimidoylglutamase [Chitinophagales bacterium]
METNKLIIYSKEEILSRTKIRKQEIKVGEMIKTISDKNNWEDELKNNNAKFILLGLPEDIGVRANYGRGGAYAAWKPALDFLINMQSNQFLPGDEILVLGDIDFSDLMEKANQLDYKKNDDVYAARNIVGEVDARVENIISKITAANKIPVIVGGGHNNAYPIIKGTAQVKKIQQGMNVINCDPHADMRPMNGRHSGNGFHYAFAEKYLNKYAVFGLHESYNMQAALQLFKDHPKQLYYETYDDIFVRDCVNYFDALRNCIEFVNEGITGIEIDLDSIQNVPVSARTPSGMLPVHVRKFVWHCAENLEVAYLHIAEGAPVLAHKQMDNKTGKLIAYIITDFVKAFLNKQT